MAALCQAPANAVLLYQQFNPDTPGIGAYAYFGQELADDFSVVNSSIVNFAKWQGAYYTPHAGDDQLFNSFTESFTVSNFANAAGLPSAAPLYTLTGLASADAGPLDQLRDGHKGV